MKIKRGSLVQVLPAKVGYYIVLEKAKMRDDCVLRETTYWELHPLPGTNFRYGGAMSEKYIEVVSEGR